jgi:hypothetical protein
MIKVKVLFSVHETYEICFGWSNIFCCENVAVNAPNIYLK